MLLTIDETADLLRTTRRAVYAMVERRQLPGIVRVRRRVLVRSPTTLREFAPRFLEGHAKANRLKASGIASKECALRIHLVPALGDKPLAEITTEDV
ncbi:MAG TPA: helix-turn-helix domain-containing protein [Vicinamibacterales bacterium]